MANILLQPYMNVLKFHLINPTLIPQYVSKHMDDYNYQETIADNEEKTIFIHQWLNIDPIREQFRSNFGTLPIRLHRCSDGAEIYSTNLQDLQQDYFKPGMYIRQLDLDMVAFPPDIYYFILADKYISEFIQTKTKQPGTLWMEFSNFERRGGLLFNIPNNQFQPGIRIPGKIKFNELASEDIIYQDDPIDSTMIQSLDYRVYEWFVGNTGAGDQTPGVPPWLMEKIKRMAGCSSLKLDGRQYTKLKGSKWENFVEDGTLLSGGKHEMVETLNRDGIIYEDDVEILGIAAAALITDTKGWGLGDTGGNDYQELEYVQ